MKDFLAGHNLDEGSATKQLHISSAAQGDYSNRGSDATVDVHFDHKIGKSVLSNRLHQYFIANH